MSDEVTSRPRLLRSRSERVIAGVCGGLARHWGWRPLRVRILFVVATVIPVLPGLPLYLLLWLLVPREEARSGEPAPHGG